MVTTTQIQIRVSPLSLILPLYSCSVASNNLLDKYSLAVLLLNQMDLDHGQMPEERWIHILQDFMGFTPDPGVFPPLHIHAQLHTAN